MIIQHNIPAMNSYRNLNNNQNAIAGNLEKLSSGYQINRAGDNAAGLAISEKMRSQITGLDAAQKNVADGISLVKTAEGALQEVHDMLNRMTELATLSANGTFDNEVDRAALQAEVSQLKEEINRISDSSNFNGQNLLDGSLDEDWTMVTGTAEVGYYEYKESASAVTTASSGIKLESTTSSTIYQTTVSANHGFFNSAFDAAGELAGTIGWEAGSNSTGGTVLVGYTDSTGAVQTVSVTVTASSGNMTAKEIFIQALESSALANEFTFETSETGDLTITGKYENSVVGQFVIDRDIDSTLGGDKLGLDGNEWSAANSASGEIDQSDAVFSLASTEKIQVNDGIVFKFESAIDEASDVTVNGVESIGVKAGDEIKVDGVVIKFTDQSPDEELSHYVDETSGEIVRYVSIYNEDSDGKSLGVPKNANEIAESVKEALYEAQKLLDENGGYTYTNDKDQEVYATNAGLNSMIFSGADSNVNVVDGNLYISNVTESTTRNVYGENGQAMQLQIGDTADDFNQLDVNVQNMHTTNMGTWEDGELVSSIADVDISSLSGAEDAISVIRDAINQVSTNRATLGAIQNRLEHTANNLSVMEENIQDAESTIRDTDVAAEMMEYTKNNILIQSSQSMLAQANQLPQGVLQLLG
ncbi:MAG: flagellin [Eubacteriales bacterium]